MRQQNFPAFALAADGGAAFAADGGAAFAHGLGRDEPQFRHTDAGGAQRLQHQQRAFAAGAARGVQQAEIFGAGKFAPGLAENAALAFQGSGLAGGVAAKFLVGVDGGQHGVDAGGGVALGGQRVAPGGDGGLGRQRGGAGLGKKAGGIAQVFLDGAVAAFARLQPGAVGGKIRHGGHKQATPSRAGLSGPVLLCPDFPLAAKRGKAPSADTKQGLHLPEI